MEPDADLAIYCDAYLEGLGFYTLARQLGFYAATFLKVSIPTILFYKGLTVAAAQTPPPHWLLLFTDSLGTVHMCHSLKLSNLIIASCHSFLT